MQIRGKNSSGESENLRSHVAERDKCLRADFCGSQCVHSEPLSLRLQPFWFQSKGIDVGTAESESAHAIPTPEGT
jgi:hypothetical protein